MKAILLRAPQSYAAVLDHHDDNVEAASQVLLQVRARPKLKTPLVQSVLKHSVLGVWSQVFCGP